MAERSTRRETLKKRFSCDRLVGDCRGMDNRCPRAKRSRHAVHGYSGELHSRKFHRQIPHS